MKRRRLGIRFLEIRTEQHALAVSQQNEEDLFKCVPLAEVFDVETGELIGGVKDLDLEYHTNGALVATMKFYPVAQEVAK